MLAVHRESGIKNIHLCSSSDSFKLFHFFRFTPDQNPSVRIKLCEMIVKLTLFIIISLEASAENLMILIDSLIIQEKRFYIGRNDEIQLIVIIKITHSYRQWVSTNGISMFRCKRSITIPK